jgi:predicted Zn-ribbon and HTH transcriptional regulator
MKTKPVVNSRGRDIQLALDAVPATSMVACIPTHEYLIIYASEEELGRIPLDDIVDASVFDDTVIKKRPTFGMLMYLGPLAFLFMKKTVHEAYRVCIQWKDGDDYHFTNVQVSVRTIADRMVNTIKHALTPEARLELSRKVQDVKKPVDTSQPESAELFVTCRNCSMEFRKTDLPPGGKCPVCGRRL